MIVFLKIREKYLNIRVDGLVSYNIIENEFSDRNNSMTYKINHNYQ